MRLAGRTSRSPLPLSITSALPGGRCELVMDAEHLDRVINGGIATAKVSVEIMTADLKAMLVPRGNGGRQADSIIALLTGLAAKGVEVRLLHAGVPSSAALEELKRLSKAGLPKTLTLRRCPRLHAKAIVVDADRMYLGSANVTGAGLGAKGATRRNFEIGVWTQDDAMIDAVLDRFNALWEGFECETCGRRDVCPEPLEEPEF